MASDQGGTGQQGGTASDHSEGFENDPVQPSDPGHRGGQMPGEQPDWISQRNDQGAGQGTECNRQCDQQGTGGSAHQGCTGGHTTGPKSDNDQSDIDEASQAVQDEDSGMSWAGSLKWAHPRACPFGDGCREPNPGVAGLHPTGFHPQAFGPFHEPARSACIVAAFSRTKPGGELDIFPRL